MENPFLSFANPKPLGAGSYEMALPLINGLQLKPGMRVLEIGAGTGQVATILAKHWGVSVVTLEPWESLNTIQAFSAEHGVENMVLTVNADAQFLPFPDDAFDAVFSIGSFLMIDNRNQALKEMNRVTRKGGYIGIAEPMCTSKPIPHELNKYDILHSYKKWLRTLEWNSNLFINQSLSVKEKYYFPEAYQWLLDNFQYYDGEREFILADNGRWISLALIVGQK